jgi:hypothetical protein
MNKIVIKHHLEEELHTPSRHSFPGLIVPVKKLQAKA